MSESLKGHRVDDAAAQQPRYRWWHRVGRSFRALLDVFDVIDGVVMVVRIIVWPIRMVAKALDTLW